MPEVWEMQNTPLLASLSGSIWPAIVALNRVLCMGQIEHTVCIQITDVNIWLLYSNSLNNLTVQKMLMIIWECNLQNEFPKHIYLIYLYEEDLALNNLHCLICHKKPNQMLYNSYIYIYIYIYIYERDGALNDLMYMYKRIWHWKTNNGSYAITTTKPNHMYLK